MSNRLQIEESYPDSKMLFADGFDDAIIGVDENRWDQRKGDEGDDSKERVIYSVKKIIDILMTRDEMEYEVAREHFDFNITGAYVGIHTPIFAEDEDLE